MENAKKELEHVIAILASLSVSGDAVEAIAASKAKIRTVIRILSESEKENPNG